MSAFGACSTDYVPDVWVKGDVRTIEATTEFHHLHLAPAIQRGKEPFGVVAQDTDTPPVSKLRERLESLLFTELKQARVFTELTRFDPQPDLVMSGRIDAFREHYREHLWTYLPYFDKVVQYLHLKSHESRGEVALTLFLLKPNGETIGAYAGRSTFDESFTPSDEMPPGARLNQAFANALRQILDQWMSDPTLRQIREPSGRPATIPPQEL